MGRPGAAWPFRPGGVQVESMTPYPSFAQLFSRMLRNLRSNPARKDLHSLLISPRWRRRVGSDSGAEARLGGVNGTNLIWRSVMMVAPPAKKTPAVRRRFRLLMTTNLSVSSLQVFFRMWSRRNFSLKRPARHARQFRAVADRMVTDAQIHEHGAPFGRSIARSR